MQRRHTDSHRKPWPHKVGFHREKGDGIKRDHFWNPKWVELQWLATCICQQEPESLFCMCFYHHYTLHTKNKRNWQESSQKKKKKANSPLTCDPWESRGCPACIQRRFKQSLWLHYLSSSSSPLHPSVDTRSHYAGADRPGITHSLAS